MRFRFASFGLVWSLRLVLALDFLSEATQIQSNRIESNRIQSNRSEPSRCNALCSHDVSMSFVSPALGIASHPGTTHRGSRSLCCAVPCRAILFGAVFVACLAKGRDVCYRFFRSFSSSFVPLLLLLVTFRFLFFAAAASGSGTLQDPPVQGRLVGHRPFGPIGPFGVLRHGHVRSFFLAGHRHRRRPGVEGLVDVVVSGEVPPGPRQHVHVGVRHRLPGGLPVLDGDVEGGGFRVGGEQDGLDGPDEPPEGVVVVPREVPQAGDDRQGDDQDVARNDRTEVDKGGGSFRLAKDTGIGDDEPSESHASGVAGVGVAVAVAAVSWRERRLPKGSFRLCTEGRDFLATPFVFRRGARLSI
mmetsp:Transcript_104732/g.213588  ORF Transcript_104732/g.213588 Transcript_104732/m.213588 type:complete len:358 (-) Transcript_104732:140-1213(-)